MTPQRTTHTRTARIRTQLGCACGLALAALLALAPQASAQDTTPNSAPVNGEDTLGTEDGLPIIIEGGGLDENGEPVDRRYKVAIPEPKAIDGKPSETGALILDVLEFDLKISGHFRSLPRSSFYFLKNGGTDGKSAETIQFNKWRELDAQQLIQIEYKDTGKDKVWLDLRMFDVAKGERVELEWQPQAVSRKEVRYVVHRFINAVMHRYTGSWGVFDTRLSYARRWRGNKHIFVADIDGYKPQRISRGDDINIIPTWSKSGIYYTSYKGDNPNLYLYHRGRERVVSSYPGQNTGASECGGTLVLTLSMDGTNTDIYTLNPKTGKVIKRLTKSWGIDTSPTWSPDCSKIAFVSDRGGGPGLYVMDADGSNIKRLTYAGNHNTTPEWSPKGDRIAFTGVIGRRSDIFVVDLYGHITRLTQRKGRNEEPTWSPDGNYIAFVSTRDGGAPNLYVMTANGSHATRITDHGGVSTPSWGPREHAPPAHLAKHP